MPAALAKRAVVTARLTRPAGTPFCWETTVSTTSFPAAKSREIITSFLSDQTPP